MRSQCSIPECERPHEARGWCRLHYLRWWHRRGDPSIFRPQPQNDFQRFFDKVEVTSSCWLWRGCQRRGYGAFQYHGRLTGAHRVSYEWLVGPIPLGLHIDHLCRITLCVNPDHLEVVTSRENGRRGILGILNSTCPRGHPYDARNNRGARYCKRCAFAQEQMCRQRQKLRSLSG